MTAKFFGTLYGKLSLALFLSFVVVGVFSAVILISSSRNYQQEITQVMHRELAAYVAENYILFEDGEPNLKAAKKTFHDLMILGPNFEFYLLDQKGKILAYSTDPNKIKLESVSMDAISDYLSLAKIEKTLLGDDPRAYDRQKIFTVAPVYQDGQVQGYLYVVLGSEIYDEIASTLLDSKILQWGMIVFLSGLFFALIATLWLTRMITHPLNRLTQQIGEIREKGFDKTAFDDQSALAPLRQWQSGSRDDIHLLGSAFNQALNKLHEQYEKVVTVDELRKELLSHVSHDLRTPLASLLGYLETWEMNQSNLSIEDSAQYISTAKKSAQKISSLVEQLFELAHLDGGNVQVNQEQCAIAELVEDVLQKFRVTTDKKGITLKVTPQDSSIKVMGDIEKLDRVFSNLIENAIRHTSEGGEITVRLSKETRLVSVEVIDTGIGIPENDLPYIFDPHFKAGNSVRENTAHGGLGLAITKKLLDLHQSTIQVRSAENQGTTFEFALQAGV